MKNETLKQIIIQIKKYNLSDCFTDIEAFKKWASKLNKKQIINFLSLDIDSEEIKNIKPLLINNDLLNCEDYKEKVNAISTLKNGDGYWHLYKNLCKPNFLNSKNFYKDIKMLSKADSARYGLCMLGEDSFINSPYHDEDLNYLIEICNTVKDNSLNDLVSNAIATVASDNDSIKSLYHQADMKLIATSGSDCLQYNGFYPERGLNYLATDPVSLKDQYHLENMQILSKNPIGSEFLYEIMTDPDFVNGKYYRKEIEALVNAKSKITARALYYYIVNPERKFCYDYEFYNDCKSYINDDNINIYDKHSVPGRNDPDYLKNLKRINNIDDEFVMYFVSLLMNYKFIKSKYKDFDIELLQGIKDKSVFVDLYELMMDEDSINSFYHQRDALMISATFEEEVRKLLLRKATNKFSLNSENHDYDMNYISKLNLDILSDDIFEEIEYYLFRKRGIEDFNRKENLEKLAEGIFVERKSDITMDLDILQSEIEENINNIDIIESIDNDIVKPKKRILSLFQKNKK